MVWRIGAWAVITGPVLVALGLRLRGWRQEAPARTARPEARQQSMEPWMYEVEPQGGAP